MYENLEHPLKQKYLMMIIPQSFSSCRARDEKYLCILHSSATLVSMRHMRRNKKKSKFIKHQRSCSLDSLLSLPKKHVFVCEKHPPTARTRKHSAFFLWAFSSLARGTFKWCFRTIFISVSRRIHNDQHLFFSVRKERKYKKKEVCSEKIYKYTHFIFHGWWCVAIQCCPLASISSIKIQVTVRNKLNSFVF